MAAIIVGFVLLIVGLLAATNSLGIVLRAVRVWPREVRERDAETFASAEFLVRTLGLLAALAGLGMILFEVLRD